MTNPWIVLLVTVAIIVLSALFVIMEFSLLGARRHRLEQEAASSRGARAALRSMNELTIMLAGAQLGITACTFILGAVTKPAVDAWLSSLFEATGMPAWLSGGGSFIVALLIVTFLHLVIGEMAPKSWAIAYPETAAKATSLPARGYIKLLRPLLRWINNMANKLVAASGVEPVERAAVGGRDAATVRRLVEHSADAGTLEQYLGTPVAGVLELENRTVDEFVATDTPPTQVAASDAVTDIQQAAQESGHLRILVVGEEPTPGVVHVRDTLLEPADTLAGKLARPALALEAGTPLHQALATMRQAGEQLAVVMDDSTYLGMLTFSDAARRLLPREDTVAD